jgi:4-diphosphocytidyl-2-C-methyl-D-erythritol kinase
VPFAELPPLAIRIDKRIPVAAGLGGGSADAAAVLRAGNELAGRPLGAARLRRLAARVGSDVPSQVEPGPALVAGTGDVVVPLELPTMSFVLAPSSPGLATADVYAELDRMGGERAELDPAPLRALAAAPLPRLAASMENDLQAAALSLRPELESPLEALREAGALAALVSGSGPTVFGVFEERAAAEAAAAALPGSLVAEARSG